jgi:hypothetical protein
LGEVSQEKYKQTAASLEFQSQKKWLQKYGRKNSFTIYYIILHFHL